MENNNAYDADCPAYAETTKLLSKLESAVKEIRKDLDQVIRNKTRDERQALLLDAILHCTALMHSVYNITENVRRMSSIILGEKFEDIPYC